MYKTCDNSEMVFITKKKHSMVNGNAVCPFCSTLRNLQMRSETVREVHVIGEAMQCQAKMTRVCNYGN